MKKLFLWMAALTLTLAGCTADDVVLQDQGNGRVPITFSTSLARTTRSAVPDGAYVFVYAENEAGQPYFNSSDHWLRLNPDGTIHEDSYVNGAAPKYYWPASGKLTFYAQALAANNANDPCISYGSVKNQIALRGDPQTALNFLYKSLLGCTAVKGDKSNPVVTLQLKNIYSLQNSIRAKNSQSALKVEFLDQEYSDEYYGYIYYTLKPYIGLYLDAKASTITYGLDGDNLFVNSDIKTVLTSFSEQFLNNRAHERSVILGSTYYTLNESNVIYLPQTLSCDLDNVTSDDSYFRVGVRYTWVETGAVLYEGDLYFPLNMDIEAGKQYTFNLDFGKGGYKREDGKYKHIFADLPLSFTTNLKGWEGVDPVDVSVSE